MAINQVLLEGTFLGDLGRAIDWTSFAHFELVDDRRQIFPCKMWLGHRCGFHCRTGDRVLAIGHIHQENGGVNVQVVSLRKLVKETWPPVTPARDAPEPDSSQDEIPY